MGGKCRRETCLQTPQHFFNKHPVQCNLNLEGILPDEQRLFFDQMAPSRDAWDVSFCCGSIARRKARRSARRLGR